MRQHQQKLIDQARAAITVAEMEVLCAWPDAPDYINGLSLITQAIKSLTELGETVKADMSAQQASDLAQMPDGLRAH
jgi:hypothetical protein